MLPKDDRVIETCGNVLNVLMQILDVLNIYIYMHVLVCVIKHTNLLFTTTTCMFIAFSSIKCEFFLVWKHLIEDI